MLDAVKLVRERGAAVSQSTRNHAAPGGNGDERAVDVHGSWDGPREHTVSPVPAVRSQPAVRLRPPGSITINRETPECHSIGGGRYANSPAHHHPPKMSNG